ncbi:hypothetical protein [Arthrobacter globiformis]|uniref:hypothetical protein n=1 Tax=Arthrobacter globiformis TaxID=1665 RepID=UPI00278B6AA4|nr:hypothetical protein [Arthrobacter globiformis]MDQ0865721.1 putative lipid-binding transport protein (Tim44 family) [Arthrobacter globiformis]
MNFKPSAGIFVAGLVTSFGGGLFWSMGMGMAATSSGGGPAGMAFVGFAASVAGLIMLCIGATRALRIIDTLPAALWNLTAGQGQPQQPIPAPQQTHQQFPQSYQAQPQNQHPHREYTQLPPVE